ncbi:transposase, Mutator family [Escherichia coli T426]|nr:transposase, Mutator family [Escherichia coli T426]
MDEKQLQALANELAKNLKTPEDLSQFDRLLKKLSVEAALNAEMTHHLGYEKNQSRPGANSRNGYSTKTVITGDGPLELRTPRDRDGTFEPQLVKKNQPRITGMDNQILSLYAKGMTTREIAAAFKELYDADVSPALISKVTDAVMEQVVEWQNRPLDAVYPIVYLDCIVLKVRQDSRVINKSVFLALGINIEGQKELLGMWLAENEGAKFWLNVLTELKNRGLNDILIACVDGLKGFPDAINTVSGGLHPVMHRAYGAQQPALRVMEGLQSRHSRPESDLSGSHGRGRPAGTGSVRCGLGQSLSSDKPKLAG